MFTCPSQHKDMYKKTQQPNIIQKSRSYNTRVLVNIKICRIIAAAIDLSFKK